MQSKHNYVQIIFTVISFAAIALFAWWWFSPIHIPHNFNGNTRILDIALFLLVSYVIWHPLVMEVLTWSISSHIKDIDHPQPVPGLKVAFITTIVPSKESLDLLHKCLPAMVQVAYAHDTWLLDEENNTEVKNICKKYGVNYFSRSGRDEYNTKRGKFTRTKGGNHNSWYDVHGDAYDIVAQVDTDFVPKPTFLTKSLGYFTDPNVAFVGTPQVYGNTQHSLIAQGASEQLHSFYGSVLRGLSGMGTTLLIGANHVIRVAALKDVDHYSAHITEDLLTGMKLHTKGWKSIYLSEPLAIGEGPVTWEAYFSQQMRWAYGCIDILFHHSANLFTKMGFRRAIYYFFLQQHYFTGFAMALSTVLLSLYFIFGLRAADIDAVKFLGSYSLVLLLCWLMSLWLQRYNVYRQNESELFLAGKIISIAAWPIWFLAFVSVLTGKRLSYKVTPKGESDTQPKSSLSVFIPHLIFGFIALIGLVSSFFTHRQSPIMLFWAFSSAILMLSVPFSEYIFLSVKKICSHVFRNIQHVYEYMRVKENKKNAGVGVTPRRILIEDCIFLGLVVTVSLMLYVTKLGFYSDDWSFLGNFSVSHNQSLLGLFRTASSPNTLMRPMQNLYDAVLYWVFGIHPLGYQLVNAVVLVLITILFYFVLHKLKVPRIIAVAVPLVYGLLPNYSTDRFWYAAFQANLSILFYFVSLYAGLRAITSNTGKNIAWRALSIFSLLLCTLSYEVALPLALVNIVLFWSPAEKLIRKKLGEPEQKQNQIIFILLNGIALLYVLIFKTRTTTRLGDGPIHNLIHNPGYLLHIVVSTLQVNYGMWGLNLPHIWWEILLKYSNATIFIYGIFLGVLIFGYLYIIIYKSEADFPNTAWMRNLSFLSIIIFILGYAIFFSNNNVGVSPTGIENRVAIAAAIGIAFSIVGGIGWISRLLHNEIISKVFFCFTIAVICTSGFIIINTLALFWVSAYQKSEVVLSDIQQQFPTLPKNSTIILDGVCRYVGPASVFESEWDLKGALQLHYHDESLQADIVTPRLVITKDGLHTHIYSFEARYRYSDTLFVYNFKNKTTYSLPTMQAAQYYFQKFNPTYNKNCPGEEGNGASVF